MESTHKDGRSPRIAIARTDKAEATFLRSSPNAAQIEIRYEVSGLAADLTGSSLQEGVAAICEREIAIMRRELTSLGEELVGQLSDDGDAINIKRNWHDRDTRTWKDARSAFYVMGSSYQSRETLAIPPRTADAHLVRSVIESTIAQREESIRITYAKILADAQVKWPMKVRTVI